MKCANNNIHLTWLLRGLNKIIPVKCSKKILVASECSVNANCYHDYFYIPSPTDTTMTYNKPFVKELAESLSCALDLEL